MARLKIVVFPPPDGPDNTIGRIIENWFEIKLKIKEKFTYIRKIILAEFK